MSRTSVATDNFNRATLGADWSQLNSANGDVTISGSTFATGTSANPVTGCSAAIWVGAGTFTDDQYSSFVLTGLSFLSADYHFEALVRCSADTGAGRDYYGFSVAADSGGPNYTTTLFKFVNGTYTALYSASQSWANTDELSLEVEGTTLRGCKNGTPLGGSWTLTDASLSTGAPGIGGGQAVGADSWEGGNMTADDISLMWKSYASITNILRRY